MSLSRCGLLPLALVLGACSSSTGDDDGNPVFAHTLYVARAGSLSSFDIATGEERAGALTDVAGAVDMQALDNGLLGVHLTARNEVLFVDAETMLETARFPSSLGTGERPVHSYITPDHGAGSTWVTLNDGTGTTATNSAAFIPLHDDPTATLAIAGEVGLGVGHHKAGFSAIQPRVVISNMTDCANVMSVYDYSDVGDIQTLATFTGADAGFTGADPGAGSFDATFCDPSGVRGTAPAPHGCGTSTLSRKVYCSVTGSGDIVVVDVDATLPTFTRLATTGKGGGFTEPHPEGRYLYTMHEEPREGHGGAACQIGQVSVIDAQDDSIVGAVPIFYRGPDCTDVLVGTPAETANLDHVMGRDDGARLFILVSGGFDVTTARVDQLVVLDTSNPAAPVQRPSITVGLTTAQSSAALSGDDHLFVVGSVANTVSEIDVDTEEVIHTFDVGTRPLVVATFGPDEGPSHQEGPVEHPE